MSTKIKEIIITLNLFNNEIVNFSGTKITSTLLVDWCQPFTCVMFQSKRDAIFNKAIEWANSLQLLVLHLVLLLIKVLSRTPMFMLKKK